MSITRKYMLSFTRAKTQCLITYYNGQFKRLEYQRGGMSNQFWNSLTKVIPFSEVKIKDVEAKHDNRVVFQLLKDSNPKSQFSLFVEVYFKFYDKQSNGIPPKFGTIEGATLKKIIVHLNKISATEEESLSVWKQIFTYWDRLDDFYKPQIQIKQINANLNTILIQIKDGNSTRKNQTTANRNADDLRQEI